MDHFPATSVPATGPLDVITIGRASVDLYGTQIGGRLEDMASFEKYIGGSPTNIAAGAARLGLRSALITRVGNEHMGRFVRERLADEGVDVTCVKTDDERLTALVILGVRDDQRFPLVFYRDNCADMALCEDDIVPDFIARARCVVATGTHLSHPRTAAAVRKALTLARANGARTALDIDFRPALWGLTDRNGGGDLFAVSDEVTRTIQSTLHLFDLVVGTEEEFRIAGGRLDTMEALREVRKVTDAALVCKSGAKGATCYVTDNAQTPGQPTTGSVRRVEVYNSIGAGDGFMAGLLKGWLSGEEWATCLTWANACGALAVSRHGCTPAYPSWQELAHFLNIEISNPRLRENEQLEQIHWATNRDGAWPTLRILAFDHKVQFEGLPNADPEKIGRFKQLCLKACLRVADGQDGYGILCDDRFGRETLFQSTDTNLWVGRPVEQPGSRPLQLEASLGQDCGGLREWPLRHVAKCLLRALPDEPENLWNEQAQTLLRLAGALRRNRKELMLELTPGELDPTDISATRRMIAKVYALGIYPDWWKLEPFADAAEWRRISTTIVQHDPNVRGVILLGRNQPLEQLEEQFAAAVGCDLVKGFAVGRSIFMDVAGKWFSGHLTDDDAVALMAGRYAQLCRSWDSHRSSASRSIPIVDAGG